ncbi:MAG: Fe-S cluster biogenesis protein NfuA [Parvicellaceae bacterium]|jgi:Fe-S cluster biogenesis protein NfuA
MDKADITAKVEEALEGLRPYLKADNGDMELVEITDDFVVRVKLLGSCKTCSMSAMTLRGGLEESIKKTVPQITRVEAVEELETPSIKTELSHAD